MKLPPDCVEWFCVPEPGAHGWIFAWELGLQTPIERAQYPHIVFRGEPIRTITTKAARSLTALALIDGRVCRLVFRKSSEAIRP